MTSDAIKSSLILDFARVLYTNGQSTDRILISVERLGKALGLPVRIFMQWGEIKLTSVVAQNTLISVAQGAPTGVNMNRVASAGATITEICEGRLTVDAARKRIDEISRIPAAPAWLFTLAAALGASALAILFGVEHVHALLLIAVSAALGAMLRRSIATCSDSLYLQQFCAALLAGLVGAFATRYELSSSLRLIAVCPCMILVPGPHILNGMMDLLRGSITLGAARLLYAVSVIVAIAAGLLLGLWLLGITLPVNPEARSIGLWSDLFAAGVAVAAYSIYFNTPTTTLAWPIAVGMTAHAVRWILLTEFQVGAATGAFAACLVVGLSLTPVSRRKHLPFAAIGFASIVSMMPGVFLFRMVSGLFQLEIGGFKDLSLYAETVSDAFTATLIVLAMGIGLTIPHLLLESKLPRYKYKH